MFHTTLVVYIDHALKNINCILIKRIHKLTISIEETKNIQLNCNLKSCKTNIGNQIAKVESYFTREYKKLRVNNNAKPPKMRFTYPIYRKNLS